jgi:hypothetical protein
MLPTNRKLLLLITAFVEAATGLCLLFLPAVLFAILFGLDPATADTIFVGRIAGVALLAVGIASWLARTATSTPAQRGLLTGLLIYNMAAAMLLAFAGAVLKMIGVLLWPAVALHAFLAVWCFCCLRPDTIAKEPHGEAVDPPDAEKLRARTAVVNHDHQAGRTGLETMRAIAILAATAAVVSHAAVADVKRHESILESLRGSWAPSTAVCKDGDKSIIVVAAKTYVSSEANCRVGWVSETVAARGPVYSAPLQCSKPNDDAQKTRFDVIFFQKCANHISIGPRFSDLKDYQRCSASEPAAAR